MTIFVTRTFVRCKVINAGRQLLMICIHLFSFLSQLVMNIKMLSVPSDRVARLAGLKMYRQLPDFIPDSCTSGTLFPFLHSQVSGSQRGRVRHG